MVNRHSFILIRPMTVLARRALAEVFTVPVLLVECRVLCAKVVGAISSEGFLVRDVFVASFLTTRIVLFVCSCLLVRMVLKDLHQRTLQ